MIDLEPIGERIIVKKDEVPDKIGRIHVPGNTREIEATEGVVVAKGVDCSFVSIGTIILFARYSGSPIKDRCDETNLLVMNESDILAIIEKPANKKDN